MSEIIRAHELKRGDIFKKQGMLFLVYFKDDQLIQYHNYYEKMNTVSGSRGAIGANSQERVELTSTKIYTRAWGEKPRTKFKQNKKQVLCK
jgi:hypothetical protein